MKNFLIKVFDRIELYSFFSNYYELDILKKQKHKNGNISILLYNTNIKSCTLIFDFEKELLQINFYDKDKKLTNIVKIFENEFILSIFKELMKYKKNEINFSFCNEIKLLNPKFYF